jgi:hypothetical protein
LLKIKFLIPFITLLVIGCGNSSSNVHITNVTSPVTRNHNAHLEARCSPGASASIEVDYESGPSHALGLYDKTADANGYVEWTWRVGSRTTPGTWPIIVTCNGESATTQFQVIP